MKKLSKNIIKCLVVPDIHFPEQDEKALNIIDQVMKITKFDQVIQLGDLLDMYSLSSFSKDPEKMGKGLKHELDLAKDWLARVRHLQPKAKIVLLKGNHEARFERYVQDKAPGLHHLIDFREMMGLTKIKANYVDDIYTLGRLHFMHGNMVRAHSAYSCKAHFDKYNMSIVIGHCFSEDTEVLTKEGWKTFDKCKVGTEVETYNMETGTTEIQPFTEMFKYSDYTEMVHIKNKCIDLLVTPEHGIVHSSRYGKSKVKKLDAKDVVGKRIDIPNAGVNRNQDFPISDDMLKLLAWVITEGSYIKSCSAIRIAQSNKPKVGVPHILSILDRLGAKYSVSQRYSAGQTEHDQHRNYDAYRIYLNTSELCTKIRELSPNKQLQLWMAKLSNRQFKLLFRELILADGNKNSDAKRSFQYSSKYENEINVLQYLCAINGYRTSKIMRSRKGAIYHVLTINTRGFTSVSQGGKFVSYKGNVYCGTVANGTLIVRRNGKVSVCSNTHRQGAFYKTNLDTTFTVQELGCLCNLKPDYAKDKGVTNWQQGFGVVYVNKSTGHFMIVPFPIYNHTTIFKDYLLKG